MTESGTCHLFFASSHSTEASPLLRITQELAPNNTLVLAGALGISLPVSFPALLLFYVVVCGFGSFLQLVLSLLQVWGKCFATSSVCEQGNKSRNALYLKFLSLLQLQRTWFHFGPPFLGRDVLCSGKCVSVIEKHWSSLCWGFSACCVWKANHLLCSLD